LLFYLKFSNIILGHKKRQIRVIRLLGYFKL